MTGNVKVEFAGLIDGTQKMEHKVECIYDCVGFGQNCTVLKSYLIMPGYKTVHSFVKQGEKKVTIQGKGQELSPEVLKATFIQVKHTCDSCKADSAARACK